LRRIGDLSDNSIFDDQDTIDVPWVELKKRWHLTLVDFGFARALGPDDMGSQELIGNLEESSHSNVSIHDALFDKPTKKKYSSVNISRHKFIDLSALGNRNYAAPEVKNRVREQEDSSYRKGVNCTLSKFVSNYGMTADAFSVGATARYLLTGVKPEENVDEVLAHHNNPINKLIRKINRKRMKSRRNKLITINADKVREKKYRSASNLPPNGLALIKAMTQPNIQNRMSVRDARLYPYVDEVLDNHNFTKTTKFLSFVLDLEGKNITRY